MFQHLIQAIVERVSPYDYLSRSTIAPWLRRRLHNNCEYEPTYAEPCSTQAETDSIVQSGPVECESSDGTNYSSNQSYYSEASKSGSDGAPISATDAHVHDVGVCASNYCRSLRKARELSERMSELSGDSTFDFDLGRRLVTQLFSDDSKCDSFK